MNPFVKPLLIVLLISAIIGGAGFILHQQRERGRDEGRAEISAQWQAQREADQKAKDAEIERINAAHEKVVQDAKKQTQQAAAAAASANAAATGLRQRYAKLAAACAAASAVAGSPPASAPGDLLANVFRRIDEAAGQLAEVADQRRVGGLACEAEYDALRKERK
jgi:hypothetical protein